ncbi:hypothetical protein BDM02DRAFT_3094751 [Thelephora ganbajun]|uniref:Uncharacterized protein n=1 Tax=Thelephora ganbajun TaxID=370292 RepID=A0ACB6ZIG9_THEGA|nr:hypothetical protein BDM02DRAFT_3094751 [Thelephora ganbajun]
MSLLRAIPQSLLKTKLIARTLTTRTHDTPVVSREKSSSTEITPQQPKEVLAADVISGAPVELRHRQVRIYVPTRNTMQSGGARGEQWRIDFDILQGGGRWENQLMGWASSADYNQALRMGFRTKEDAIHFAEKQGWDYYVQPETVKRIPPKNYSESFVYKPEQLRIMRTK